MYKIIQGISIVLAGLIIGIADAMIKKSAIMTAENIEKNSSAGLLNFFATAFSNKWLIGAIILYLLQISFFVYVFAKNWKLGVAINIQIVFVALASIIIGYFIFHEKLSLLQMVGALLACIGVLMMTSA